MVMSLLQRDITIAFTATESVFPHFGLHKPTDCLAEQEHLNDFLWKRVWGLDSPNGKLISKSDETYCKKSLFESINVTPVFVVGVVVCNCISITIFMHHDNGLIEGFPLIIFNLIK